MIIKFIKKTFKNECEHNFEFEQIAIISAERVIGYHRS